MSLMFLTPDVSCPHDCRQFGSSVSDLVIYFMWLVSQHELMFIALATNDRSVRENSSTLEQRIVSEVIVNTVGRLHLYT